MRSLAGALLALSVCLALACGREPSGDEAGQATGTTPGAEAAQAIEAQNTLTSTPVPAPPVGAIGEAREAAEAANAHVQALDSIVGTL
jgi:hypothetical protein